LIALLRTKVNDTDGDIWLDDQLQDFLDMNRVHVHRERLIKCMDEKVYYSRFSMLEDEITLWDSDSAGAWQVPADSFTANLVDGVFSFTQSETLKGGDCYLDGRSYNLHGAIAECLEQLAMDPNKAQEWSRGGVRYSHYDLMEMARYHRSLAGARNTALIKTYRTAGE
jgi:hypothetical protein